MADLNINKSDTTHLWEDAGQSLIPNANFESAPTFTAVTTTNQRWIDGTAAGSTTDDSHYWAIIIKSGSVAASFDSTTSHSGSNSMKLSTTTGGSSLEVRLTNSASLANYSRYYIPVKPSMAYIMSFYMKTNVISGTSSNGTYINALEYSASSTTALATTSSTHITTTTNWTLYTISFTTTSTTAFVTPSLLLVDGQIMDSWFDDLQLQSVAPNGKVDIPINTIITLGVQDIIGPKIWS